MAKLDNGLEAIKYLESMGQDVNHVCQFDQHDRRESTAFQALLYYGRYMSESNNEGGHDFSIPFLSLIKLIGVSKTIMVGIIYTMLRISLQYVIMGFSRFTERPKLAKYHIDRSIVMLLQPNGIFRQKLQRKLLTEC